MKVDRLLGIVIYLLNREIVSATALAEKFEVSRRTIQRDVEVLNMSGIPIVSIQGTNGGYQIIDSFKLQKQVTTEDDYSFIIAALKGMASAYNNKKLEDTLEKFLYMEKKAPTTNSNIILDFNASKEGNNINEYIKLIEYSMKERLRVEFEYVNAYGTKTNRIVEPIIVMYRWYAWYTLAYCEDKRAYRMFKIIRMRNLKILETHFLVEHEAPDKILNQYQRIDSNKYIDVVLLCHKDIRVSIEEYFSNGTIKEEKNGRFIISFTVPEHERGWLGILMSYGGKAQIIEPESLREKVISLSKEIISTNS